MKYYFNILSCIYVRNSSVTSVLMQADAKYLGLGIWSKAASFPDVPTRLHFVSTTCCCCLINCLIIYLSQLNSIGYWLCWRMLFKDYCFLETSFYWQTFRGVGKSASTYFWPNLLHSHQKFNGKTVCADIIGSSSKSPVRHNNYSNWLVFYYLTRPRPEGMF